MNPEVDGGEIWVFCESRNNVLLDSGLELVAKASELAGAGSLVTGAAVFGDIMLSETERLFAAGADRIYVIQGESGCADDGIVARGLVQAVLLHRPEVVLTAATIRGRSIAPQAAALLRTGLTADCTELSLDTNGLLVQTRPAFGNSLLARIVCATARPQMASVRPGVFAAPVMDYSRLGEIVHVPFAPGAAALGFELLRTEANDAAGRNLIASPVVVGGGMGLGGKEGFAKLERFAFLIGAACGASRAAVHSGFAPYAHQVGQTGVTVRPKLYLAFGISGAVQHQAGMASSECIVAVDSDPKAPIFGIAHYGVVADANVVLNALLSEFSS